jgi:transposase
VGATTLEANAALRYIVGLDSGERYEEFLTRPAKEAIETPTREQIAKLDRKSMKKGNNQDWSIRTIPTPASPR